MPTFIAKTYPISNNDIYIRPQGRYVLSPAARKYKEDTKLEYLHQIIEQQSELDPITSEDKLDWFIYINMSWFTKSGSIRKVDLSNYEKVVSDTVIQALSDSGYSLDDSQIFRLYMIKVSDPDQDWITKVEFSVIKEA